MKKKVMRKSSLVERAMVSRRFNKKSEKRVQHLRNRELEQAQAFGRPQMWHAKQTTDKGQPSANI